MHRTATEFRQIAVARSGVSNSPNGGFRRLLQSFHPLQIPVGGRDPGVELGRNPCDPVGPFVVFLRVPAQGFLKPGYAAGSQPKMGNQFVTLSGPAQQAAQALQCHCRGRILNARALQNGQRVL